MYAVRYTEGTRYQLREVYVMQKVTMKDVAGRLGVSINAVSLALSGRVGVSEALRARVVQTAWDMGYFEHKTQALKKVKLKNLLVILKTGALSDVHFHNVVFQSMQSEAKRLGYDIMVEFLGDLTQVPSAITDHKVSGVIIFGTFGDEGLLAIARTKIPMVLVNHETCALNVDTVVNKNYQGAQLAIGHLYRMGHRRIGYAGYATDESSMRLRKAGFIQAALDLGIYGDDPTAGYRAAAFEENLTPLLMVHNAQAIADLLIVKFGNMQNLPTAFFCCNDATAIGMMGALALLGVRVPQDVSLVSFDNIPLAQTAPTPLTTIDIPIRPMGARAVRQIVLAVENKPPRETILLPMQLVERESVQEFK